MDRRTELSLLAFVWSLFGMSLAADRKRASRRHNPLTRWARIGNVPRIIHR